MLKKSPTPLCIRCIRCQEMDQGGIWLTCWIFQRAGCQQEREGPGHLKVVDENYRRSFFWGGEKPSFIGTIPFTKRFGVILHCFTLFLNHFASCYSMFTAFLHHFHIICASLHHRSHRVSNSDPVYWGLYWVYHIENLMLRKKR